MIQNIIQTLFLIHVLVKLLLLNSSKLKGRSSRRKGFRHLCTPLFSNVPVDSLFNMFRLYDVDKTRNLMARLSDIAALVTLLSFYIHKKLIAEQEFNYSLWVCAG